jgi:cyclohexanone monooxygenase
MANQRKPDVEVVVIGAGITGIYQTYLLNKSGISVRGYEAGADVGGTWYWNRYPGCRLDTESYAYGYFALNGIIPEWEWKERFASQGELLEYANAAADKMDVRRLYEFNTPVTAAHFDEESNIWKLTLGDGRTSTCRFLVSAVGPLSATRLPNIPGIDTFAGRSFHSSRWPWNDPSSMDFTGKRVAVLGTGATGVQIIPIAARTAARLTVLQRTPNWCAPLGNSPLKEGELEQLRGDPKDFLEFLTTTETAFPYRRSRVKAAEATPEEREALFEELYNTPGYGIWLSGYRDLLTNKESNQYLADFVANKIRGRVKDQAVAEKLIPKNHAFGTRRAPLETNYYEVYNQDNVELVDISEAPIECINANGVLLKDGTQIDLDVLIFATGFDGVTGALDRMDIRGKNCLSLKDAWAHGPETYLGLQITDFPNLFTLVGAHNGASFCNIGVCGALQVEWLAHMVEYLHENGLIYAEARREYQNVWTEQVYQIYAKTLLADADAWWSRNTVNADGTVTRRALIYVGSATDYRDQCEQSAQKGYEGFDLR